MKKILIFCSFTLCLAISGYFLSPQIKAVAEERYSDLQLFAKVLNLVEQYYVETVDLKKLIYGGIKGILRELDPHTNFMPPDIYKEFESETSGEFGGIGIEMTVQNGVLIVISPIEDTPAWKAGIQAGDKIVSIDGEPTKGMSLVEVGKKMKGKTGVKIKLGIMREGFDKAKVFTITRGIVKIHSVKYVDMQDGFAYIRLTSFIENSTKEMEKALKEHEKKNKQSRGLILDLRKNPGGLLDQAIQISDLFLDSGTIVSTMGRNKKEKEVVYAKKAGTLPNFPIVVLIDEYSASASEILAGALRDNKRALIMGRRSFGKGSVQSVIKLGDGSALKLTVGRYYTPSGRSIQAEGISPDIELPAISPEMVDKISVHEAAKREQDIQGHLLNESEHEKVADVESEDKKKGPISQREKILKEDYQAQQALNQLRAWNILKGADGTVGAEKAVK